MALWNQFFYVWDKGKDGILWWTLTLYVAKNKEQKMAGLLMMFIALIRMLCQLFKITHIITEANQAAAVFILFALDLGAMVYIGLGQQLKRKSWHR